MGYPSNAEQELLELINRARADPMGEAARLVPDAANKVGASSAVTAAIRGWKVDLKLFFEQMAAFKPVAPLAWNNAIADAAEAHSAAMIKADMQSHRVPGEEGLSRIETAGYKDWNLLGENVAAYPDSVLEAHAGFVIDWGKGEGGMQTPAGHRANILSAEFWDVGIDATPENDPATKLGTLVVTQDFGSRFENVAKIVGVAFRDKDGDRFYDAGEGLGGVTVTAVGAAGTFVTTTWSSGGYQLEAPAGTYTLTFSGGGLETTSTKKVTLDEVNVKSDLVTRGGGGHDRPVSAPADEAFEGSAGLDWLALPLARSAATVTLESAARVRISGPGIGSDTASGIERLAFSDGVLALDTEGSAGQTYRLYQAAFDRVPDRPGLSHNVALMDHGVSLREMAAAFAASQEFAALYGRDTSDETFIALLYRNVLDRAPEAAGLSGWKEYLATHSRAEVLIGFSESLENKDHLAQAMRNGILLDLSVAA